MDPTTGTADDRLKAVFNEAKDDPKPGEAEEFVFHFRDCREDLERMRVRCGQQAVGDEPETAFTDLTLGNVYRVIGIEADSYRVINDEGRPYLHSPARFEVIDSGTDADWVTTRRARDRGAARPASEGGRRTRRCTPQPAGSRPTARPA